MGLSISSSSSSNNICFLLFMYLFSLVHVQSFDNSSSSSSSLGESLDTILHDHAFKTLFHGRPHTGTLYNATLPDNLAGMNISVVRLRSRTLWRLGANFSHFHIPPETLPIPHVRRLLIVYHDLGNYWSSYYCNISGYTLLTSVIGFAIFDASNSRRGKDLTKLDLDTKGKPIVIQFKNLINTDLSETKQGAKKCATFGADGRVDFSDVRMSSVCYSTSQGHFSIVSPLKKKQQQQQKIRIWGFWVMGFALGVFMLLIVGLVITVVFRARTVKRTHDMEREAEEGEVLHTFWVDSSKMPRATVTRTYPALESSGLP